MAKTKLTPPSYVIKPNKKPTLNVGSFSSVPEMNRPTFSLTSDALPEIKEWKVGGKYKLQIEVEQTGSNKSDFGDMPAGEVRNNFKILSVAVEHESDELHGVSYTH